jgi:hypothetical protein
VAFPAAICSATSAVWSSLITTKSVAPMIPSSTSVAAPATAIGHLRACVRVRALARARKRFPHWVQRKGCMPGLPVRSSCERQRDSRVSVDAQAGQAVRVGVVICAGPLNFSIST